MALFGNNFNWTSGVGTFTFASESPFCAQGIGLRTTFPPANGSDAQGNLIPRAVIPGAFVVANITKVEDFKGNITVSPCGDASTSLFASDDSGGWTPQVGQPTSFEGQCLHITVKVETTVNCSGNKLEIEAALIGDFCARSPTADVCKNHDPKATVPPTLRASLGADTSISISNSTTDSTTTATNATAAPSNGSAATNSSGAETKSGAVSVRQYSTRRLVLGSVVACAAVAMALL